MKRFLFVSATFAVFLSGCQSNVGESTPSYAVQAPAFKRPSGAALDYGEHHLVYVTNASSNAVTVYHRNLALIHDDTRKFDRPTGIAVVHVGFYFVANAGTNTIQGYVNGKPRRPTIGAGIDEPEAIAIDSNGKLYVANYGSNTVTTYLTDGTQTTPTITIGIKHPRGIAVDENGKIYVTNASTNSLTTYLPDGTQTTPTITGLSNPAGVAIAHHRPKRGAILIVSDGTNTMTTYDSTGNPIEPTITGLNDPRGIAQAGSGRIYIADHGSNLLKTFGWRGVSFGNISQDLSGPTSVALY